MSPLTLELVRRLSILGLILALLLLVVPRALTELGVLGPDLEAQIAAAERSLEAARIYGGTPADPDFKAAQDQIATGRGLAARGETWRARQAARRAKGYAVLAQRAALTEREAARQQLAVIGGEIDRRMSELDDLYAAIPKGGGKNERLVPMMKDARRAGASVLLAIEEGEYRRAVGMSAEALATLERARATLLEAKAHPSVNVTQRPQPLQ